KCSTLYGDCIKGRRPSFIEAAKPEMANKLYEKFIEELKNYNVRVETGEFGADMKVELLNDGPVTLVIDTPENIK
ncbi:MAG: D-aminoacyl-tRNA deacylase, partial [Cetobacterium sp.]|nr:D-aminoacyl-tRNA deacylase [Cetobacterium sp.]